MLDLKKLFTDVFAPEAGEVAAVMVDYPHGDLLPNEEWEQRREMAKRWHAALSELGEARGFSVVPLIEYAATGAHNGVLPATAMQEGASILLHDVAAETTLLLALTEYSASAPLIEWTKQFPQLRAASMPRVAPAMEQSALAADYSIVARSCSRLLQRLKESQWADIEFSNGDRLCFDFRYREPEMDDGRLPRDLPPPRLINLPSGEAYTAAYEDERGEPSKTAGVLPVPWEGEVVRLRIENNRVEEVLSTTAAGKNLRDFLFADRARCNVAELGLGCNSHARVWGNVLEDEKAGPHIALGRSEHLGGSVGPGAFSDAQNVWHEDFVYARGCPVEIRRLSLRTTAGEDRTLYENGSYAAELEVGI